MGDYEIKLNPYRVYNEMEFSSDVPIGVSPGDMKIKASVWNKFADVVGVGHIKRFITFDNAIDVINKRLNNASSAQVDKVAELFGFHKVTQEEAGEYDRKAMNFLSELAADPSQIVFTKKAHKSHYTKDGYILEAKLPDGRGVEFLMDKFGGLSGSVIVNFDTTPNGVNYQNIPIDYSDVYYSLDYSDFSYTTKDGKNGNYPKTDSSAYEISGADNAKVKQLSKQIISAYKNE